MKTCKNCGTENIDKNNFCPKCGGNEFVHRCRNCGVELDSNYCPNCGKPSEMYIQRDLSKNPIKIWIRAREHIIHNNSSLTFLRWMDELYPVVVRDGILVLEAPDELIKKGVTEHYLDSLRNAVHKADEDITDIYVALPSQRKMFSAWLSRMYSRIY